MEEMRWVKVLDENLKVRVFVNVVMQLYVRRCFATPAEQESTLLCRAFLNRRNRHSVRILNFSPLKTATNLPNFHQNTENEIFCR